MPIRSEWLLDGLLRQTFCVGLGVKFLNRRHTLGRRRDNLPVRLGLDPTNCSTNADADCEQKDGNDNGIAH